MATSVIILSEGIVKGFLYRLKVKFKNSKIFNDVVLFPAFVYLSFLVISLLCLVPDI